jgi:hypothetical protein
MFEMQVKEETSTKLVLEMDPSSRPKWSELGSTLIKSFLFLGFAILVHSISWLFWAIIVGVVLVDSFLVYLFVWSMAQDVLVIVDLNSQHAVRTEKFRFNRIKQQKLDLEQVSRVLVHCEDVGKHCRLLLESSSAAPLEISIIYAGGCVESLKELGNKIGRLVKRPVAYKITDQGHLISEETIQT